jgi:hypothetical protein
VTTYLIGSTWDTFASSVAASGIYPWPRSTVPLKFRLVRKSLSWAGTFSEGATLLQGVSHLQVCRQIGVGAIPNTLAHCSRVTGYLGKYPPIWLPYAKISLTLSRTC